FAKWDLEQDYEQRQRKGKKEKSEKLLVKTSEGWKEDQVLEVRRQQEAENEDADSFMASGDEDQDSGVAD
ncbi:hypothetical protein LTR48_009567, partial [Friedmanniomyces endolithicus]